MEKQNEVANANPGLSGFGEAAGSAGVVPVSYQVYLETGTFGTEKAGQPFYTLEAINLSHDDAIKTAQEIYDGRKGVFHVKIFRVVKTEELHLSPNVEVMNGGSEE